MRSTSRQTPPPSRGRQGQPRKEAPRERLVQPEPPVQEALPYPDIDEPTRPLQIDVLQAGEAGHEDSLFGETQPVPVGDALLAMADTDLMAPEDDYPARQGRRGRRESAAAPTRPRFSKPVLMLAAMLGVLLVFGTGLFAYASKLLGDMRYDQNPSVIGYADATLDPEDLETPDPNETLLDESALDSAIPSQTAAPIAQGQSTYNILLLGLDTRKASTFTGARSDVMMLVTLDTEKKTIKLTSFMRDIIIAIPGHGKNRLNTAFVWGGPDLTKQMLSQYFGVQVDNYAIINFWAFASVIDGLGGVTVDLKSAELANLNKNITEINGLSKKKSPLVRQSGSQKLNGTQAIGYMRIRHGEAGGGDFERTNRQRTVMTSLTTKLKTMNVIQAAELVDTLKPFVKTDMSPAKMVDVAGKLISVGASVQVQQLRIPVDDGYHMGSVANVGKGILLPDFDKNVEALKQFLEN